MDRSTASGLMRMDGQRRFRALNVMAAACLLSAWCRPAVAQEKEAPPPGDLPKAEVVLDQVVDALGGRAALEKIRNRVTKGTFEIPAQSIKGAITTYEATPNRFYQVLDAEGLGKIEEGVDGAVCWQASQMGGPRILEGLERDTALHRATFNKDLEWRKLYTKAETAGIEQVDGKSCYKLVMTPTVGEPEKWYVDQATHLIEKTEIVFVSQIGNLPIETWPSDYKAVDGVLLPFSTKLRILGGDRFLTVESYEHNVDSPKDLFEPPAAVKALLETGQGKPPAKGPEIS